VEARVRTRFFVLLLCLITLSTRGVGTAPQGGSAAVIALTNANVVVGNGQVLQRATVVVQGGIIRAVGAKAAIPAGATVVDLKGSYLYPAFIDALTVQGLKRAPARQDGQAGQAATGQAPPPPDHAGPDGGGFFAHVQAADQLDPDATAWATWRDAGILTLHVSPDRGIFEGQTSVVTLEGEAATPKVVRRAVGMRIALRTLSAPRRAGSPVPGGLYPGALLSVWSHIKQTVLDAQYAVKAAGLPATDRASIKYAEPVRALDALRPVAEGTMPLIIPAQAEREVQRVIDLADQFHVRCIVAGGYEAARHADALKAARLPVLVSLNFPRKKVIALGQQAQFVENPAPAAPEETYQEMRARHHAPEAPGELARAGVRFAFASDGLKTGEEFLANLRLAVSHGLPRDAAIRAATLSAAEILGIEQQLGSIEAGKIANLIVADGDLFDVQTQVKAVYVGGHERTVASKTAASAAKTAPAPAATPQVVAADPYFPPPVVANELLIRNATVMTATHGTLQNTSILVHDGKIAAIGANLEAGPRARVVDATGKWVTPGFIDTHNHIGSDAHNDATIAVTSMTNIQDVINPTDIQLYRALSAGVTMVNTMHGSVNPIGGQNVLIKTAWGKAAKDLVVAGATPTLKVALGSNPKSRAVQPAPGVARRYPASRMGIEDVIRSALADARDYKLQWDLYEKAAGHLSLLPPRRDLTLEPLAEVLTGKRLIIAHAYQADEMLTLMRLAEEFGFRIGRFEHGNEAYKIAPELARHGAGVAAFDLLGTKVESWDGIPQGISILVKAGVSVSIGTDGGEVAHMAHEAARTLDWGLTPDQALGLITINAAKQHGIDKFAGSIDVGKDANLVIFDKYPLSVYATPEQVYIDGQLYFSRERDRERQKAIEADKKRLTELDGGQGRQVPNDR
jgi:imidazolonepropionase-like amidohydrolase